MKLALYHYESCPFCHIVRHAIEDLGLSVELRNIHASSRILRELVDATGRRTVPCLWIESDDGEVRWMPESRDIVRFLSDLSARGAGAELQNK